jgi:hypothetical protein
MHKKIVWLLTGFLLAAVTFADAQQPKVKNVRGEPTVYVICLLCL